MGGFSIALPEDESKQFSVNAEQFCWLIENEIIELPTISVEDIKDKSKMNSYTKCITIFQTLWFLLQTIARGVQGLSVSTLEITTVAYITCMLPWMAFWWRKPYDVGTPTRLKILRWPDGTRKELEKHSSKGSFLYRKRDLVEFPRMPNTISIEDHWMTRGLTTENPNWYGAFVDGLLFGGLHCAAWSFEFPTLIECWLWRASGLVIVFMAFLGLYLYWWRNRDYARRTWWSDKNFKVFAAVYVVLRIYLKLEVFLEFRAMPASVYQIVDWMLYIPSF